MAEKALKKVEDQLNCSICLDTYTNPKLLQCFHVFCHKCLVKLVVRDQQGQLVLTCPICRQDTPVPANGVAGLPPAFQINHLLEIMEEHKRAAADTSVSAGKVERVSAGLTPQGSVKVSCSEHAGKEVEFFCETCGELICYKCAVKGGKHHDHSYEELDKAFQKYKEEISVYLQPMEKQLTTTNQALAKLDRCHEEISDQRAVIEADVHGTFQRLQEILDIRKTEVIGQLHQITESKLQSLAVQRDQIETTQAQLSSCLGFMKKSVKMGRQEEVLSQKSMLVKQVKELTTSKLSRPKIEPDMIFSVPAEMTTLCQKYGQISSLSLPDPSKCHATGKGTEAAVVGETSTAALQVIDHKDLPCKEQFQLECNLVSEITGSKFQSSITEQGCGQYEISYSPTVKGRHLLHIKVEGQHVRGSPFSVMAKAPLEKLGTPILTTPMKKPYGVAINQRGEVVVTERDTDRVSVLSPSGERLRSFGTRGSGQGQFKYPCGVAVDGKGNILVADCDNHRVQKFAADGQFLTAVGSLGGGPLQFNKPYGITVNTSNDKVYVSDLNNRIQVLNPDLTFASTFGKPGNSKGHFVYPYDLACDSKGDVYVTDYCNHRIQVFSASGKFMRLFGRSGKGTGELGCPNGVTVDPSSDMVYVTEYRNHRVSVFTSSGAFLTAFGSCGDQPGQFLFPHGVAVDGSGVVYVCDCDNNCLQLF